MNVAVYYHPLLPQPEWQEALSAFDVVVVPSEAVAEHFRLAFPSRDFSVVAVAPPIDIGGLRGENHPTVSWLDEKSADYRFYAVIPPHEVGAVYPLVLEFLREYRTDDAVSLTIRALSREGVEEAVEFAAGEIGGARSRHARVKLLFGPWNHRGQVALAHWGDCCLCPWAGCWPPVEASYALAAGNFVAAPAWSAGECVTKRSGTLLNYEIDDSGCAVVDWGQVAAVMRIAAANGRRERSLARSAADDILCESGHFLGNVMSKLDVAPG